MSGTKVETGPSKGRLSQAAGLAKGPEQHRKNKRVRKTTERTLLQQLVGELDRDSSVLERISSSLLAKAEAGDKDALAFIGKYLLGNGKVSLDELYNPPLIKKSRS